MPCATYHCKACNFVEEYIEGPSIAKENWHPEVCPKCHEGTLEKIEDWSNSHGGFDITGYCYDNVYGKKNWKRGKSDSEISQYLTPDANGRYKDPY